MCDTVFKIATPQDGTTVMSDPVQTSLSKQRMQATDRTKRSEKQTEAIIFANSKVIFPTPPVPFSSGRGSTYSQE